MDGESDLLVFRTYILSVDQCVFRSIVPYKDCCDYNADLCYLSWMIKIIIAPRLFFFGGGGHPAVGFGPKLKEMNPRTFPDLPIRPRTLDVDQKTLKITKQIQQKI